MFSKKPIVIDGRGHILGRLAGIVAKNILSGQKVVVVRCEEIQARGDLRVCTLRFKDWLRKRHATNPRRGAHHHRSPAKVFLRSVWRMVPRKTIRGRVAFARLRAFEGIPAPFDKQQRVVAPRAMKIVRMKTGRVTTSLGVVAKNVGWVRGEVVARLETARKAKSAEAYKVKSAVQALRAQAVSSVADQIAPLNKELAALGY